MRFLLLIFTLALLTPTVLLQDPGAGLSEEMLREAVKQQKASIENKMKKVLDFKTAAGNKSSNSSKTTKPPASKPFQNNSDAETVVYGGTPVTSRTGYQYMARIELAPAAYPSQRINLAAGVIISTSYVLSTAYPFVVIRDSAGSAGSFLYYVVVGDLKSAYIESDEEEFLLAPEEIIVHPEFIDPSKNPLGMTKNNLAIFPLPTSITSTTSSYIEIDISKVSNDLSGYDVDIAGWTMVDPTSSAAGSAWQLTQATFTGSTCPASLSSFSEAAAISCYYNPQVYAGPCSGISDTGDMGTGVTLMLLKKIIPTDFLVAINQFSMCDSTPHHYSGGSALSYQSHYSFVCKYALKCRSFGKPLKWIFKSIFSSLMSYFLRR